MDIKSTVLNLSRSWWMITDFMAINEYIVDLVMLVRSPVKSVSAEPGCSISSSYHRTFALFAAEIATNQCQSGCVNQRLN